jgi:KUP system potassium uptake protein
VWGWRWWQAALLIGPLVVVDATFFSANLLKLFEGAWLPLLFGISMVLLILTWRRGTGIVVGKTRQSEIKLESLVRSLERKPPHIVPGTAVFLTSDPDYAPTALLHTQAQ